MSLEKKLQPVQKKYKLKNCLVITYDHVYSVNSGQDNI